MDEQRLRQFMGNLISDMGGAAMMASVLIGDELGLYRAMADGKPITAAELGRATGCNTRLLHEWLSAQAASGYVDYADGRFRLSPEQSLALADEKSPVFIAGGIGVLASMFLDKDKVVSAMRGDGALPWGDHHPCTFSGTERFFRTGYRANLVSSWLPALEGVVAKLEKGAKVADIGCGHGASTVIMAQAYPKSQFFGFDLHEASIETAKERAVEGRVSERAHFALATAKTYPEDG